MEDEIKKFPIDEGIIIDETKIKKFVYAEDSLNNDAVFDKNFKNWKYRMRLGNQVYVSTEDIPQQLKPGEYITIKPGDFVLLLTKESVSLPQDVMAFISMRFDYKMKGLINVSGFHVDPGFQGKLIFSAFNAGPRDIVIRESDPIFMIFFQKVKGCKAAKNIGYESIPAEMVEMIKGKSATLASNAARLDHLEFYLKIMGGFSISLLVVLLGVAIRAVFK